MLNPRAALGHALTAGANLRCDDRPGAVDALIALGMVRPERAITAVGGIEARDLARFSDLFSLLLRVKWGQQEHSLPALRAQMIEFCRFPFARQGWAVHDRRRGPAGCGGGGGGEMGPGGGKVGKDKLYNPTT